MDEASRKARRIGGSSIAGILKKSKWRTPLDVYLELTDPASQVERSGEDIDRGNFLEPAIREWASKKTGLQFLKPASPVLTLPEWDWATVSPDGLNIVGEKVGTLLEIKAPRRDDALFWGEQGTDEVPNDALFQTHWGMMVANAEAGVVAALIGGELRIYRVKRDREFEGKLLARAKDFVEQFVLPRVPPPAEYGDEANIRYLHPNNVKPHREWASLSPQEQVVVESYLTAWRARKDATDIEDQWKPVVEQMIADADGITLPAGRIDWKVNGSASTKWKQLAESLMQGMPDEERQKLEQQFAGKPNRPLVPRPK